jgi:hypothetical protein
MQKRCVIYVLYIILIYIYTYYYFKISPLILFERAKQYFCHSNIRKQDVRWQRKNELLVSILIYISMQFCFIDSSFFNLFQSCFYNILFLYASYLYLYQVPPPVGSIFIRYNIIISMRTKPTSPQNKIPHENNNT